MADELKSTADVIDAIFGPGAAEETWSGEDLETARRPTEPYIPPPNCKHVKIKIGRSRAATLQHPAAALGTHDGVRTIMITNVPHGTPAAEVARRYSLCIDTGADVAYSYHKLTAGRILR